MPEEKPSVAQHTGSTLSLAGDCGVGWLRKAYDRCVQQAKDEGSSLEDVAAERYGV